MKDRIAQSQKVPRTMWGSLLQGLQQPAVRDVQRPVPHLGLESRPRAPRSAACAHHDLAARVEQPHGIAYEKAKDNNRTTTCAAPAEPHTVAREETMDAIGVGFCYYR